MHCVYSKSCVNVCLYKPLTIIFHQQKLLSFISECECSCIVFQVLYKQQKRTNNFSICTRIKPPLIQSSFWCIIKGMLHLWKECVFKMGHLCRRNVKLFLNLELCRLRKARKCIFGLCG